MCTLAVALRVDRRWPLVVAANRDERLGRPAESWSRRQGAGARYAAPCDLQAGGTWIGVSESGLFAALTNYHAPLDWYPDPARRTRGELVGLALRHPSATSAMESLCAQDAERWNPFHLVVADAQDAYLWLYDGESVSRRALGPGLHIVTESSPEGADPRGDWLRSHWPLELELPRLREVLAHHPEPLHTATCIHRDPDYGTRSSAVLRLAPSLAHSELYVAEGPPCLAPFENRSDLLAWLNGHS